MPFYSRDLEIVLKKYAKFPVIALLGPRQSGKTTLSRHTFKNHVFLNLDDLELLHLIKEDPKGILRKYENEHGIIIDEFQNAPEILSYIKIIVDEKDRPGYFVLTGSQNFLMNEAITQTLAGRVGILTLLPLSLHELTHNKLIPDQTPEKVIFNGGYPRLYNSSFEPHEFYSSYIRTYVERDVRQLINVTNLYTFQKFIKLCAARIGQLVNFSELAMQCGISIPTAHQWLSILESSYIIFLLRPHWTNFNKRLTKTPKLYFYDTGLACNLLEIESEKTLALNPLYGNLFECLIISDLYKQYYNQGLMPPLYFWRDRNGQMEVDCVIEKDGKLIPIEIKAGETFTPHFFDSLTKWKKLAEENASNENYVIYAGTMTLLGTFGILVSWKDAAQLIKNMKKQVTIEAA